MGVKKSAKIQALIQSIRDGTISLLEIKPPAPFEPSKEPIITECALNNETPVRQLDIPIWMANVLGRNGYSTIGRLIGLSPYDLSKLRGVGKDRTAQIENMLKQLAAGSIRLNYVEKGPGTVDVEPVHLREFVAGIPQEVVRDVATRRMSGQSMKEIGAVYGCTKQWAQLKLFRAFRSGPPIIEQKYLQVFMGYKMTEQEFYDIFHEDSWVYNYIKEISPTPQHKKRPLEEALTDKSLNREIREAVTEYIRALKYVNVDGTWVLKTRSALVQYAVCTYCQDGLSVDEFLTRYHRLLERVHLNHDKNFLFPSTIAFTNRLSDMHYVVYGGTNSLRYYNYKTKNFKRLFAQLNLEQYAGQTVSAWLLYHKNRKLMRAYNIKTGGELHWVLRHTYNQQDILPIVFGKMPTMHIRFPKRQQEEAAG